MPNWDSFFFIRSVRLSPYSYISYQNNQAGSLFSIVFIFHSPPPLRDDEAMQHFELLETYDAWLRGATVEASWEGKDCLTGGMYSGCGPQCDAGWINWIFWKLYFDSTIDVRRPCGFQRRAFAACVRVARGAGVGGRGAQPHDAA